HAPIRAWQNIPVVSYLLLRGKCASCGARISLRYPIVELLTASLSAIVAWHYGFGWQAGAALVFTWMLIALAAIDLDTSYLFDNLTLPLLWLGLLVSLAGQNQTAFAFPVDPRSSIIGAMAGYLSLWSVYHVFRLLTGKEGMGYGDFKLFAAFGAWFGWQMLPLIILLSAFTGALVGIYLMVFRRHGRDVPIPFGPYLAAAGWIALIWGPTLVERYLHMTGLEGS
ncbi:MAG TPA: A24 family peptidase, partial [Steroidobacteraceae bacterium]|nr:A24 family peptidase [Steroidobacteraceae bacterium]